MNQLIDRSGRLFLAIRIQLDSVPARARFSRNGQERCPVPDAGIDRGERRSWIAQAGPNAPGFGKRQRKISATGISLIAGMDKGRLQVAIDPHDVTLEKMGDKWIAALDLVFAQRSNEGADLGLKTTPLELSLDKAHYDQVLQEGLSITKNVELTPSAVEVRVVVVDRASGRIGSLIVPVK
jgi:hypothetical protein